MCVVMKPKLKGCSRDLTDLFFLFLQAGVKK